MWVCECKRNTCMLPAGFDTVPRCPGNCVDFFLHENHKKKEEKNNNQRAFSLSEKKDTILQSGHESENYVKSASATAGFAPC